MQTDSYIRNAQWGQVLLSGTVDNALTEAGTTVIGADSDCCDIARNRDVNMNTEIRGSSIRQQKIDTVDTNEEEFENKFIKSLLGSIYDAQTAAAAPTSPFVNAFSDAEDDTRDQAWGYVFKQLSVLRDLQADTSVDPVTINLHQASYWDTVMNHPDSLPTPPVPPNTAATSCGVSEIYPSDSVSVCASVDSAESIGMTSQFCSSTAVNALDQFMDVKMDDGFVFVSSNGW